jgi:transcriptional regulator with XRE-family HTH domain
LAELIAVSQSTLARWEQRNIPPKDEEAIGAIAQHLRLDMDVLLGIMEEQAEDVEGDELVTPTSRNARLWEKFAAHFKAGDPETFAEVVASLPKNDQAMLVRLAKLLDIESKLG